MHRGGKFVSKWYALKKADLKALFFQSVLYFVFAAFLVGCVSTPQIPQYQLPNEVFSGDVAQPFAVITTGEWSAITKPILTAGEVVTTDKLIEVVNALSSKARTYAYPNTIAKSHRLDFCPSSSKWNN
jgi:hypothetical protein